MPVALAVALFGSLGALSRYAVTRLVEARSVSVFPWATFLVNVTGCFLVALVIASLVDRHAAPDWVRVGLVVGFLGAYTTFSALGVDVYDSAVGGHYAVAAANAFGSLAAGVAAVALGTIVGRAL
jgi:CrcB protein